MSKFGGEYPRSLFVGAFITSPLDQVQEFASATPVVDLGVQNLGDLKLRFTIDNDQGQWWLNLAGYGVRWCEFELRDVVDRVYGTHVVW